MFKNKIDIFSKFSPEIILANQGILFFLISRSTEFFSNVSEHYKTFWNFFENHEKITYLEKKNVFKYVFSADYTTNQNNQKDKDSFKVIFLSRITVYMS